MEAFKKVKNSQCFLSITTRIEYYKERTSEQWQSNSPIRTR